MNVNRQDVKHDSKKNAAPAAEFITSNLGFFKNIWLSLRVISHFSAELKHLNPL